VPLRFLAGVLVAARGTIKGNSRANSEGIFRVRHGKVFDQGRLLCEVEHCNYKTSHGKPFCVMHIARIPAIRALLQELSRQDKDAKRLAKNARQRAKNARQRDRNKKDKAAHDMAVNMLKNDLTGTFVGRLEISNYAGRRPVPGTSTQKLRYWDCLCACGNKLTASEPEIHAKPHCGRCSVS